MVDRGLTHVALPVSNLNDSIAFYTQYARMQVVHRRTVPTTGFEVAWMSDKTRPFVIVLSERNQVDHPLVPPAHLGVACESREEVDRLCALARGEGRLLNGPRDAGPPIGLTVQQAT
jgi:catechol 2,3-dioxygenase-like lactoylglutathione lyase family enzyme